MDGLPDGFSRQYVSVNGLRLHVVHNGRPEAGMPIDENKPAILFLHGFPEFWIAWREVFVRLGGDYLIIAPDQRGFNLSDAPEGREHYKTGLMVSDMLSLCDQMIGNRPFHLAGHDWGASVAYAIALSAPERVSTLTIANGVHPVCFQNALTDDPAQAAASQYFHVLTSEGAEARMSANDYAKTFSMFEKFSSSPWLDTDLKAEYRAAWSKPGRLKAMLNWYGSSPIVVPNENDDGKDAPLYRSTDPRFDVKMPHLLIWGMGDQALLPVCFADIGNFASDLTVKRIEDADHWVLHTHPEHIAREMLSFLNTHSQSG